MDKIRTGFIHPNITTGNYLFFSHTPRHLKDYTKRKVENAGIKPTLSEGVLTNHNNQ